MSDVKCPECGLTRKHSDGECGARLAFFQLQKERDILRAALAAAEEHAMVQAKADHDEIERLKGELLAAEERAAKAEGELAEAQEREQSASETAVYFWKKRNAIREQMQTEVAYRDAGLAVARAEAARDRENADTNALRMLEARRERDGARAEVELCKPK